MKSNNVNNAIKIKLALFDLDGTVYLDGKPIDGAEETLSTLRERNVRIGYLTNNSSRTDEEYLERLNKINLLREGDILYSSLDAAVDYLNENYLGKKVYALATEKVDGFLRASGINLVTEREYEEAEVFLLSFDKELTYNKIVRANNLLKSGVTYIATHPDKTCPAEPFYVPDVGSFIELLKASSGRVPDIIIGKPFPLMAEIIEKKYGFLPSETIMVGDRLSTDIAFGINAGLKTALVLSGETTRKQFDESGVSVDFVLKDLNGLRNVIK